LAAGTAKICQKNHLHSTSNITCKRQVSDSCLASR
jgi:hypothetical protein